MDNINKDIYFVHDFVEKNGKTIKDNNLNIQHRLSVGTLVEIRNSTREDWEWTGMRMYICKHTRDRDGYPLYSLGPKETKDRFNWSHGFTEDCLREVRSHKKIKRVKEKHVYKVTDIQKKLNELVDTVNEIRGDWK